MNGNDLKIQALKTFHEGTNCKAYEFFGCHKLNNDNYVFRVWAPHAKNVYLSGSFNTWSESEKMTKLSDGESFELITFANTGDEYIYIIQTYDNRIIKKSDPYAFYCKLPPNWASVVYDLPDNKKINKKDRKKYLNEPINIYEVNLLSWKRHENNFYYSYVDLERELVPYVKNMGYTHVEFMPVTEFPYDGSWGYQVTGYFAVTSRLGTPQEFKNLINAFHKEGISVILDWVPAHFPKDDWGLYEFDGQPLYECPLWDRMEHNGWGTRKFDFGRGEIDSFLLSSAVYLFDIFDIDGLRVDAVASMLYLDYETREGDFTPNNYGDNRNLQAIEFIKKLNSKIKELFPYAITIAEESTAYPSVTGNISENGLGFDYKWNMGWMNDVLFYCRQDPYFRNHHHNKLTFSMVYAYSEKFILPVSHDEVVHVKGSLVNKMPGKYEDKFAGERAFLGFMFAHPGKKLNFMGYEFAQFKEWDYNSGIEFFLKQYPLHSKMSDFVKELNFFYRKNKPFYENENDWNGFKWLVADDKYNNVIVFMRFASNGENITAVINFSGIDLLNYSFETEIGKYYLVLNTDDAKYGGSGKIRKKTYSTINPTSDREKGTLVLNIPKLTCMYLKNIN